MLHQCMHDVQCRLYLQTGARLASKRRGRQERSGGDRAYSTISRAFTPAAASVVGVPTSGVDVPVAFPLAAAEVFFFFFFLFFDEETGGRVRISTPVSVILAVSACS